MKTLNWTTTPNVETTHRVGDGVEPSYTAAPGLSMGEVIDAYVATYSAPAGAKVEVVCDRRDDDGEWQGSVRRAVTIA